MSLNTWSLILFSANILFYLSMVIAIATRSTPAKLALMISSWIGYQVATLWYGIATDQLGFILMFIFQIIVSIATLIISTERPINEDI
jgi:hypothetical protein